MTSAGYRVQRVTVTPAAASVQQDVALQIDAGSCTAPGYARTYAYRETFDASDGGWTGSGTSSWAWGKPTSGPGAAHSGTRVWATHLAGNYSLNENGYLVSPPIDLSRYAGRRPVLMWSQWLQLGTTERRRVSRSARTTGRRGRRSTAAGGDVDLGVGGEGHRAERGLRGAGIPGAVPVPERRYANTAPGWYIDDVGVTVLQVNPTPVYSETFDTSNGGYASGGTNSSWAWGTPTTGPGIAHSGAGGMGDESGRQPQRLRGQRGDVARYRPERPRGQWLVVNWWQWLQTEGSYDAQPRSDGGRVDVDAGVRARGRQCRPRVGGEVRSCWTRRTRQTDSRCGSGSGPTAPARPSRTLCRRCHPPDGQLPLRTGLASRRHGSNHDVATVEGRVTDGSGQGFPLYARIDIAGRAMPVFTNPTTGALHRKAGAGPDVRVHGDGDWRGIRRSG